MKVDNVVRVFRYVSMDPTNVFYTILMGSTPWKVYCSNEFMANNPSDPNELKNLERDEFIKTQILVSDDERNIESFFRRLDVRN